MEDNKKDLKVGDIISHSMFVEGIRFQVKKTDLRENLLDFNKEDDYKVQRVERDPKTGKWIPQWNSNKLASTYIFEHSFDDEYVTLIESAQ